MDGDFYGPVFDLSIGLGFQYAEFEVVFSKADYRDYIWQGEVADADFSGGRLWPDNATLGGLSAALSIPLDPTKSIVIVTVSEYDSDGDYVREVAGATVTATAAFDVALAQDSAAALGISAGNVTISGGVILVNVAAGAFSTSVAPPTGTTCTIFPGGGATLQLDSVADSLVHVGYRCTTT